MARSIIKTIITITTTRMETGGIIVVTKDVTVKHVTHGVTMDIIGSLELNMATGTQDREKPWWWSNLRISNWVIVTEPVIGAS